MKRPSITPRSLVDTHGYTLIELLVAMSIGIVVSLAAFSFLGFTTSDVSRITERVHIDQTGRVTHGKNNARAPFRLRHAFDHSNSSKKQRNHDQIHQRRQQESALTTVYEHEITSTLRHRCVAKSYQA